MSRVGNLSKPAVRQGKDDAAAAFLQAALLAALASSFHVVQGLYFYGWLFTSYSLVIHMNW